VIAASPTTHNFVQTHKALFNAWQALRPGGRIVLAAPCREGLGGEQFVQWLRLGDRPAIIAALRQRSEINGQTALSTIEKGPSTLMVTVKMRPTFA
jgi:nickel-dependent lactate racemase